MKTGSTDMLFSTVNSTVKSVFIILFTLSLVSSTTAYWEDCDQGSDCLDADASCVDQSGTCSSLNGKCETVESADNLDCCSATSATYYGSAGGIVVYNPSTAQYECDHLEIAYDSGAFRYETDCYFADYLGTATSECDTDPDPQYTQDGICATGFSSASIANTGCDSGEVCYDTMMRMDCSVCGGGYRCDTDATNFAFNGVCTDDYSADACDTYEVCYDTTAVDYYGECQNCVNSGGAYGDPCEVSIGSDGYQSTGVCVWDEGGTSANNYDCDVYDTCDDSGSNALRADCSMCDDGDECDFQVTGGAFAPDGICIGTNCDDDEVCYYSGTYYNDCSDCYSSGSTERTCDYEVGFSGFYADGICVAGGICDNSGHACYDDTSFQDDCSDCSLVYSADPQGDSCDTSITDEDFTAKGMCTYSNTCTPTGSEIVVRSDLFYVNCIDDDGDICDSVSSTLFSSDGVCVAENDAAVYSCDVDEVCQDAVDTYDNDCMYCTLGDVCDSNVVSSGFQSDGVCTYDEGGATDSNYDCATVTVCDDTGFGAYRPGCSICDDADGCMANVGSSGYTRDGRCASSNCCTTIYVEGGTCSCGSDASRCDASPENGGSFDWEGVCATGTCDAAGVCFDGVDYEKDCGLCYSGGSTYRSCDEIITSSTGYVADGICVAGGICDALGHTCYDSVDAQYENNCLLCQLDYDDDPTGDYCDTSIGSSFGANGFCTFADTCTPVGSIVSVDADNGNVFEAGCNNYGHWCDSSVSTSWTGDGICVVGFDCELGDVYWDDESSNSHYSSAQSSMYTYTFNNNGDVCDSNVWSGGDGFVTNGMVVHSGGSLLANCHALNSVVRVDAGDNYFKPGCGSADDNDMCDTSISGSTNPFTRNGYCCDSSCTLDYSIDYGASCCRNENCISGICGSGGTCLKALNDACSAGSECGSGLCIEGFCRSSCLLTYDGDRCSDNSFAFTNAASGICMTTNALTWTCEKNESAIKSLSHYSDCYYMDGGRPSSVYGCDNDVAPSYTVAGVCAYSSGTINLNSILCDTSEVCFDDSYYRSDCNYCGQSTSDTDSCDGSVSTGVYSANGICTADGNCDTNEVCLDDYSTGTYYSDCSSANCADGYGCDNAVTSVFGRTGRCAGIDCCISEFVSDNSCGCALATNGLSCDNTPASGGAVTTDWDGICVQGATDCDVGDVYRDDEETYEYYNTVTSAMYTHSGNIYGDTCDTNIVSGVFDAEGMVVQTGGDLNSNCLSFAGGSVRIDGDGYFKAGCGSADDGDGCDDVLVDSPDPFSENGDCCDSSCIPYGSVANGGSCCADINCASNDCTGGICQAPTLPDGSSCTSGSQCISTYCIDTDTTCGGSATCQTPSSTYDGRCCSDNGQSWTNILSGTIGRTNLATSWDCDHDEMVFYSSDYYQDCYYPWLSTPTAETTCDIDVSPDYSASGICSYSTGGQSMTSVDCDNDEMCYDDAGYRSDCAYCSVSSADIDTCDRSVGTNYVAEGYCTTGGTCSVGDVYNNGGTLTDGCSNGLGHSCDSDATGSENGLFSSYDDGICVSGSICDTGDAYYDDELGIYYGSVQATMTDHDTDSSGDSCDSSVSNAAYSRTGMAVLSGGVPIANCQNFGATVRVDASDGNRYKVGCGASDDGDACDSSIANSNDPYSRDGYCCGGSSCDLDNSLNFGDSCCNDLSCSGDMVCYAGFCNNPCYDADLDGFYNESSGTYCAGYRDCNDNNANILPPYDGLSITSDTILCNGTYFVNATGVNDEVITFGGGSLNLTCNGTTIIGNTTGYFLRENSDSNLGITGCNVSNYTLAYYISSSSINNQLYNLTSWNNTHGFFIFSGFNNLSKIFSYYDEYPIRFVGVEYNNLTDSYIYEAGGLGIRLENANNTFIKNVSIINTSDSANYELYVTSSYNNTVRNSTFYGKGGLSYSTLIQSGTGNLFYYNSFSGSYFSYVASYITGNHFNTSVWNGTGFEARVVDFIVPRDLTD